MNKREDSVILTQQSNKNKQQNTGKKKQDKNKLENKLLSEFEDGPIVTNLCRQLIPKIIACCCLIYCKTTFQAIVGQTFGDNGLNAFSICQTSNQMFISFPVIAIAQGTSIIMSDFLGKKQIQQVASAQAQYFLLILLNIILTPILYQPVLQKYFTMIGVTNQVMPYAMDYGKVLVQLGVFEDILTLGTFCFFTYLNQQHIPMIAQIISEFVQLLSIYLSYKVFKFKSMKIAAYIGIIPNMIIGCVLVYILFQRQVYRIQLKNFKPQFKIIKRIYLLAFSMVLTQIPQQFKGITATFIMKQYSKTQQQAQDLQLIQSIVGRTMQFCGMSVMIIVQGVQPILSYNLSAKKIERVYKILKIGYTWVLIAVSLVCTLIFFKAKSIVQLFTKTQNLVELSTFYVRISVFGGVFSQFYTISIVILQLINRVKLVIWMQFVRAVLSLAMQMVFPAIFKNPELLFYSNILEDINEGFVGLAFTVYFFWKYNPMRVKTLREYLEWR